jgi:hypothetical protein
VQLSDNALRDYARRVLKSEQYQSDGILLKPQYSDIDIDLFVEQMNPYQLNELYWMMFKSEFVE